MNSLADFVQAICWRLIGEEYVRVRTLYEQQRFKDWYCREMTKMADDYSRQPYGPPPGCSTGVTFSRMTAKQLRDAMRRKGNLRLGTMS